MASSRKKDLEQINSEDEQEEDDEKVALLSKSDI
jgi:hypothetical protein